MKPLSLRTRCAKCGCGKVEVYYHEAKPFPRDCCGTHGEHMKRKCSRCGYWWLESPIPTRKQRKAVKS